MTEESIRGYQALLEAYPDDILLLIDQQERLLLTSGSLGMVISTQNKPSLDQALHDVFSEELYATSRPFIQQAFEQQHSEWRFYTARHILQFNATTLTLPDDLQCLLITVNDDTEQLRLHERLRSDAERYRAIVEDNIELICRFTPEGFLTFINGAMCDYTNKDASDLIGTSFYRLLSDTDVPRIQKQLRELTIEQPTAIIETRVRSFGATQQWVRWSFHAISDAGGHIAEIQSVGYDITDRIRAQTNEKRQRDLAEALRNIATVLNSTLDLQQVFENIIDIIDLVVRYDTVNVMLVDGSYAAVVRGRGYNDHHIKGVLSLRLRIRRVKHLRYMMETGREFVIPNIQYYDSDCMDVPELCWVQSYAGAPIVSDGQVIGFLNLESRTPDFFEPEHGRLVRAFADHAATAIRNAQLYEQAQRIAIVEERQRLARELHDAVSQTLFSANMIADSLPLIAEKKPHQMPEQLRILREQTTLAMVELRTMLYELVPQSLAETHIRTLLEQLIQSFSSRTEMMIALSILGQATDMIDIDVKVVIYRIVQEGLNNAIQHAKASQMHIELRIDPTRITLNIQDDGQDFDPTVKKFGHMGLGIMQERAQAIGADLTIDAAPNQGTHILLQLQTEESS